MKIWGKRWLALILSAALLIGCTVSGLVLPTAAENTVAPGENLIANGDFEGEEWSGSAYQNTEGYGDSKGFYVTSNYQTLQNDLRLKQSMQAGKWYILRFKTKGDVGKLYVNSNRDKFSFMDIAPNLNDKSTVSTNEKVQVTENDWVVNQRPFQATEVWAQQTTITKADLLFYLGDFTSNPVYYDDFELLEYTPGMNVMPAADGSMLPYAATGGQHFLWTWLSAGATLSTEDGAWKISNLNGSFTKYPYFGVLSGTIIPQNGGVTFSFRYKGEGAKVTMSSANANNATLLSHETKDGENGWKIYKAYFTLLSASQANSAFTFTFSGADSVLIDDFYYGETVKTEITEDTALVQEGKSVALDATTTPAGAAIIWESSDNTVATVENGVVTGIKPGNVTITATAKNGESDTCAVTVVAKPTVEITQTSVSVQEGKTHALNFTAAPSDTVVNWESTDNTVATVKNGVVTALKPGTATITATVDGGNFDTCEVTVTKKPTVSITEEDVTVERGTPLKLTYTTVPADTAVTWTSSSDAIATVTNGIVVGKTPGTATITATVDGGNFDTCHVTVTPVATGNNLIANGDFEGEEWPTDNIVADKGYGGSKAVCVTGAAGTIYKLPPTTLRLKEPLSPDKYYVFRFKVQGDLPRIWGNANSAVMSLAPSNAAYKNAANLTDWMQCQTKIFSPSQEITAFTANDLIYLYKSGYLTGSTAVYYDDFEIFEYVPGTSVVPGFDGTLLPLPNGTLHHQFYDFFSKGATLSLADDNGNAVWKLDNINAAMTAQPEGPILRTDILSGLLNEGETGKISFRYKGDAVIEIVCGNSSASKNVTCETGDEDEDGWKTVTAEFTYIKGAAEKNVDIHNGGLRMKITGADSILIDDYSLVEVVKVAFAKNTLSLEEGQLEFLAHTVSAENTAVTWLSNDDTVATVKNGVITAHKAGTVTVMATTVSGESDTCTVTVKPAANVFPDSSFEKGDIDFGFEIKNGVGFGGGKALVIPSGTKNAKMKTVTLSKPLKANTPYVLRYKVKGLNHTVFWVDSEYVGTSATLPSTSQSTVADGFIQTQYVFVSQNETDKLTGFGLYNTHATDEAYLDDFEIFEYIPGMDMFPDTEGCAALPITSNVTGGLFGSFLSIEGVSVTDVKDGDDYVIQFSGLDAESGTAALLPLSRTSYSKNVFDTTDRDVVFSFKYKSENNAATAVISAANAEYNNAVGRPTTTAPDADGWRTHTARINIKAVSIGGTARLTFKGASQVWIKDVYMGESVELSLSDLTWTPYATQIKTGTSLSLSVKLTNNSSEAIVPQNEIAVHFIARKGNEELNLGTAVKKGGMQAGESVVLTTPTAWEVPAGDWVISAHASTAFGGGLERIGTQGHFHAADTLLVAPNEALAGGFDTLTFGDEFDDATVDTEYTGDYGYKWYLTDVTGVAGDKTDYSITDGVMTLAAKNMRYTWLMATMDAYTAAGWHGFTHGYLEYRTRFKSTPNDFTGTDYSQINTKGAPGIWSFPPEVIASNSFENPERYVEMDWMEYWGYDTNNCQWTITMHDQTRTSNGTVTNSVNNRGSNHILSPKNNIGDGQWHTVGYRWEKGLLIVYLDGREIFYQDWSENGHSPESIAAIGEILDDAFTPLDEQLSPLIIGSGVNWPLEIDYIRVWQKNAEQPYKFPVDNAETPVTELYWAPNTSAATPLSGDKTLCWRTDNPTVASVGSNGVISTHHEGKALITVYKDGKAVQQYAVTVDRYGERMPFGDFELAANDSHKTWHHSDSTYTVIADGKGSIVTETDGNRALTLPAGKSGYLYGANLEAGKTYRLSGRVKGDASATLLGFYTLNFYDSNTATNEQKPVPSGKAGQWVEFSYTFTTTSVKNGAYQAEKSYSILLRNSGSTAAYFDDLSLVETDGFVVNGIGTGIEITSVTKNAWFNLLFGPTLSVANYNLTLQSQDTSILANTSSTQLTAKAFGSAYVTVTAKPSSGTTLTATAKVSVVAAAGASGVSLFTAPHTTVKFQNSSGSALTSLTAGSQIKVKVSVEDGYMMTAGSLRFTTADGAVRRINNRDTADNTGNTFVMTVPSGKFVVDMKTMSTAQTNFSMATIGTAVRYQEGTENINGVRFLTRMHIDGLKYNESGRLVLTYNGTEYVVKEMGSLLKRVSNTAALTLENARDTQYKNATSGNKKIWQTLCYQPDDNGIYGLDATDGYFDFAVSMLTSNPTETFNNRRYEVRGYIELKRADGTTFTLHSDSMIDSVTQALGRAAV